MPYTPEEWEKFKEKFKDLEDLDIRRMRGDDDETPADTRSVAILSSNSEQLLQVKKQLDAKHIPCMMVGTVMMNSEGERQRRPALMIDADYVPRVLSVDIDITPLTGDNSGRNSPTI